MHWHFVLLVLVLYIPPCFNIGYERYDNFKTIVEINDHLSKSTYIVEEYHATNDGDNWDAEPEGALIIKTKDKHLHITYRTDKGEVNTIDLNAPTSVCQSSTLKSPLQGIPVANQWNWKATGNYSTIVGPSAMILEVAKNMYQWHKSKTSNTTRGVQSTKYFKTLNNKLNLTMFTENYYYYSTLKWKNPIVETYQMVLSLHLLGTLPADGIWVTNGGQHVNITYNFMLINDHLEIEDRKFLQIPAGRGCTGDTAKQPQTFQDGYSIEGEVVVKKRKHFEKQMGTNPPPLTVANFQLKYDFEYSTYSVFQSTYTEKNGVVSDNSGYNYTIVLQKPGYVFTTNTESNECYITKKTLFPLVFNLPDGTTLSFGGPDKLFNFNGYKYLGMTRTRGFYNRVFEKTSTLADSGISLSTDVLGLGGVILTFYELDSSAYTVGSKGQFLILYNPMKLEISVLDKVFDSTAKIIKFITINFINYQPLSSNPNVLDNMGIEHCFPNRNDRLWFEVTYKGRLSPSLEDQGVEEMEEDFINKVSEVGLVSAVRIIHPRITFQKDTFRVYAGLLQRPDALVDFKRKYSQKTVKDASKFKVYKIVLSEGECAKKCLRILGGKNSLCLSFVWCDSTCYLYYKPGTPDLVKSTSKPTCVYNVLLSSSNANTMEFSEDVIDDIAGGIQQRNLNPDDQIASVNSLNITYSPSRWRKGTTYYAISITTDLPRNSGSMSGRTSYNTSFTRHIWGYKFKGKYITDVYGGNSIYPMDFHSCERQCENEPDFYCEAFTYCVGIKSCLLSTYHPGSYNKTEMAVATDCGIFSRNYLENYKKYPGIVLKEKGFKTTKVSDANGCANLCSKEANNVHCQSFDYCGRSGACILHETHFLDIQSTTSFSYNDQCEHYSRKYLFDYQRKFSTGLTKKFISITYSQVSVQNCSRLCSMTESCTSFDFCTGQLSPNSACHLSTSKIGSKGMVAPSQICNYFSKIYDKHGNFVGPITQKLASKKPFSAGVAGGVGFAMVVIGLLLGAGAVFGFVRFRAHHH